MKTSGQNRAVRIAKRVGNGFAVVIGTLLILLVVMPPLFRGATDRWGATDAEAATAYPGDELVPDADQASVRAISIDAPPELVFALVKQMGYGRGGWYAWDWFYQATGSADFVDGHSSRRIDPQLQRIDEGDGIELFPGARLDVIRCDAPRALVLYKCTDAANRIVEPGEPRPAAYSELGWGWIVSPDGEGGCRLILRTRGSDAGLGEFAEWVNDKPLEMVGSVFAYKTLRGIKRTAERLAEQGVRVDESGSQIAGPTGGF